MSNLADKTEYKVMNIIAQMVKQFEKLDYLDMTKEDDWNATNARNLLQGIIENNEYKINYNRNSKKSILKSKLCRPIFSDR